MAKHLTFRQIRAGYIRLTENQGFPLIVLVCVGIITATALWTGQQGEEVSPTPTAAYDVSAAQLQQQLLRDAQRPTAAPTAQPPKYQSPVDGTVLQSFDAQTLIRSGVTGIWSVHDAVDIAAPAGSAVLAMADGVVLAAGEDALQGVWLRIDHGDGTVALYAGMRASAEYIAGDTVRKGDRIGTSGAGTLAESSIEAHLHLRVTRDGTAIDPMTLWTSAGN